jgi:hypothetical protein
VRFVLGRAGGRDEATAGDLSVGWDGVSVDEHDGVSTFHSRANAQGKAAEIIGKGLDPDGFVRTLAEGAVFERLSGNVIDDRIGLGRDNVFCGGRHGVRRWKLGHDVGCNVVDGRDGLVGT